MEQGSTLHDSNQNTLISVLINNLVPQTDYSTSIKFDSVTNSENIHVTADANDNPIQDQDIIEAETLHSSLHNTESEGIGLHRSESVKDTSITDTIRLKHDVRKSVSHTNIRKTIDEIKQRSSIPASTMPQNALLETALSVSNIATSSGNEFIPGQNMELMTSGHVYQPQNWNTGSVTSGNNANDLCEAPGYVNARQPCLSTNDSSTTMAYPSTNMPGCFPSNELQRGDYQTQQFMQATCSPDTTQLDQFLQSTQMPMQGYQQQPISQDTYVVSTAQGLTSNSSYDKVDSYNTPPMFINNNLPTPVSTPYSTDLHQTLSLPYNDPSCTVAGETYFPKPTHIETPHDIYSDITPEEGTSGNRNNEKKLTTTPIPSDAEKMSSSSSVSSCSPEESPSSQETDSDQSLLSSRPSGSKPTYPVIASDSYGQFSSKNHVNQISTHSQLPTTSGMNSGEGYMNESLQNQIPVPENVVEIDESSIEFNRVEPAISKNTIPSSSAIVSDQNQTYLNPNQVNSRTDHVNNKEVESRSDYPPSYSAETNSSWSVLKEERRKQKLEKKMLQAKQLEQSTSSGGSKLERVDSQSRKHHRHKHKHRSKHHSIPPNIIAMPMLNDAHSYSGLIPKVNADPTNNRKMNYKPSGPPRSITEKVKQQMMQEKMKAAGLVPKQLPLAKSPPLSQPNPVTAQPTAPQPPPPSSNAKSNSYSHIAPSKFGSVNGEPSSDKNAKCRWQTVTAIEGPKLPPVLSEIDRIPKRGRPSKKMTQINLKFKGDAVKQPNKVVPAQTVSETPNIVSMYTINESGAIEKLENRPKQNQRSKERAEAFRNELLEISKKTIIQKKTAGAKDVVGAFKAVGVRTRKQASNNNVVGEREDNKKKTKVKNKVFGGDSSNSGKPSEKIIDEDCAYTFSELAKQFKISNSILHRAIEQSHRSSVAKKTVKSSLKQKEKERESSKPSVTVEKPTESQPPISATDSAKPEVPLEKPSSPPIKPTSLSSEKSADLTYDVAKRKKKKNKHKKEKNELGKKKKNKDKKKKSKRKEAKGLSDGFLTLESNNEVFSGSTLATESSVTGATSKPTKKTLERKSQDMKTPEVEKTLKPIEPPQILKKVDSLSSLSAVEDECEGGLSSSDVETSLPSTTESVGTSSGSTPAVASPTTSAASAVFGSGISAIMPTFQGIKEHGGLQQFSEHTKNLTEGNLFRAKKHKHKKKKLISRAKNVADPEFLSKIEKLVESLRNMRLSSNGFQTPPFGSKPSNVFATTFQVKPISNSPKKTHEFSYRDPALNRSKQKHNARGESSVSRGQTSSKVGDTAIMSVFCRSVFFKNYGYIKPYTISSKVDLLKSPISQSSLPIARNKFEFTSNSTQKAPVFSKGSSFVNSEARNASLDKAETNVKSNSPQSPANEAPVNTAQGKSIKRKRGWPRGKPRGSRKQLSAVQDEPEFSGNDGVPIQDVKEMEKPQKSSSNLNLTSTNVVSRESRKPDDSPSSKSNDLPSTTALSSGNTATSTSINQDLVNHIKAAITASLSSAVVCSDTVAKTVDSAVASYFQNFDPSSDLVQVKDSLRPMTKGESSKSKPKGDSSKPTVKKLTEKSLPRGRPSKYAKLSEQLLDSTESSKISDKHPKKLWASKHQSVPTSANTSKPEKRTPGRPRKYPSVSVEPPAKIQRKGAKALKMGELSKSEESRISAAFAPPPRATLTTEQKQPKSTTRGRRPLLAAGSNVSVPMIKKQKESTKTLKSRKINMQFATNTEKLSFGAHSSSTKDDLLNKTGKNRKGNLLDDAEEQNKSDSSIKGTVKRSLESVVAKLKSKQTPVSLFSNFVDEECSENQSLSKQDIVTIGAATRESMASDFGAAVDTNMPRKKQNPNPQLSKIKKRKGNIEDHEPRKKKKIEPRSTEIMEKKWLEAGLFSPSFKRNSSDSSADTEADKCDLFPPPIHAGLFLRSQQTDFQIPHDIFSLHKQRKIGTTQNVTETYFKIEKNMYYDVLPTSDGVDPICDCSPKTSDDENCGKNCLNKVKQIECSEEACPCESRCTNNAIRKNNRCTDMEKFETADKGLGLKATADIPQGQFLVQCVGEVVSEAEFNSRWVENYFSQSHHYALQLEAGRIIDSYRYGNESRFINHSCQPNCEMQRWYSGNEYHLCLFAKQPIKMGEELTYDYATHAYNLLDQHQVCRCGVAKCRGKIGGNLPQVMETCSKTLAKHANKKKKSAQDNEEEADQLLYTTVYENHMQPASAEETLFIKAHKPFLLRNLTKIKHRHELLSKQIQRRSSHKKDTTGAADEAEKRKLLYDVVKDTFDRIMGCKDENGVSVALPFINLRLKQPGPDHKKDPFDLSFVEDKIVAKQYEKFEEFSADLLHAFRNAEKQFGRKSSLGKDVSRLRRVYASSRNAALSVLGETKEKGKNKDTKKSDTDVEDRRRSGDFIRCICGIYKDEGVMIQCEKCYVWQHCDCMQVKPGDYNDDVVYLCEECDDREVPQEVEVVPQPPSAPPGHTYYLTLLKDNLLIRQGDCVRVIHDHCLRQRQSNNPPIRSSYRLQSNSAPERMNFFRIVKLWTDDNGDKFAYGYHFVRPNDTKHTESRTFFTNELLATPYHEIVPLDAVVSRCCVMDLETYRRGKPKEFKESDIFICQHRTDLSLRIVNAVIKNRYPICTKAHVFDAYPVRLVTVRNYQVPEQCRKSQSRRMQWLRAMDYVTRSEDEDSSDDDDEMASEQSSVANVAMDTTSVGSDDETTLPSERNFKERRLNGILKKLIQGASARKPSKTSEKR